MATQLHYLVARQRQTELADRAERVRQRRDDLGLDAPVRDHRLRDRVMSVLRRSDGAFSRPRPSYARAPDVDAYGNADEAITLRLAGDADSTAVADLAGLDSGSVPAAPVLIAEGGGEIRAALSLRDGAIIANPFHRTLPAQQLLRARAAQLRAEGEPSRRRRLLDQAETAPSPLASTGSAECRSA